MNTTKELLSALFDQSENDKYHMAYSDEMVFYSAVQSGDEELLMKVMKPFTSEGMGVLSSKPIRNLQYHLVITVALITRFCIEGGMNSETAYTLSDLYIRKLDVLNSEEELNQLHKEVALDFTRRMKGINKKSEYPKSVRSAIDFISDHVYQPISLEDIADYAATNPSYLSSVFKRVTGTSISSYIQKKRVETAKSLLAFSDESFSEISNKLNFSSHSYFIAIFKKHTGLTPKEYRDRFYEKKFIES